MKDISTYIMAAMFNQINQLNLRVALVVINLFLLINAQYHLNDDFQFGSDDQLTYSLLSRSEFVNFNQIKEDNQNQRNQLSQLNQLPNNFTIDVLSSNSVRLKWQPPHSKEVSVLQYKLKYEKLNSNKHDTITLDSKINTYKLENLDSDSEYRFKIGAVFVNDNLGPFTKWKQVQTLRELDETRVPDKPEFLVASGKSTRIHLRWGPPLNKSVKIREYLLNFGVNFPDINHLTIDASQTEYTIKDLQPKQEYVISLRANNKFGAGEAVYATAKTTTKEDDDQAADEVDEEEEELNEKDTNQDDKEQEEKTNHLDSPKLDTPNTKLSSHLIPKASPDLDSNNLKEPEVDPELLPPLGVKAEVVSSNKIRVSWLDETPMFKDRYENKKDQSYLIKYNSLIDKTRGKVKLLNTTDNQILIEDLKPFTKYEFAVKFIKRNRASIWSMISVNTTNEALPAGAPRDLIVMPISNLIADKFNNNPLITNKIPINDLNGAINQGEQDNKLTELAYTGSSGLNKQSIIKKAKSAISKTGKYRNGNKFSKNSKQSFTSKHTYNGALDKDDQVNDVDENEPNSQNYVQYPEPNDKLDADTDKINELNNLLDKQVVPGLSAVSLSWQPAKQVNGETLGYLISYNRNGSKEWFTQQVHGDQRSTVVHNLIPETIYYFKARVRNKKGMGPYSSPVQFRTLPDNSSVSTNTLYVIIAIISSISLLLLIVISSLLCKSKKNHPAPIIGNNIYSNSPLSKRRSNSSFLQSPLSASNTLKLNKNREFAPPDLWINHDPLIELDKFDKFNQLNEQSINSTPILQRMDTFLARDCL